jgi:hypothetical protein
VQILSDKETRNWCHLVFFSHDEWGLAKGIDMAMPDVPVTAH